MWIHLVLLCLFESYQMMFSAAMDQSLYYWHPVQIAEESKLTRISSYLRLVGWMYLYFRVVVHSGARTHRVIHLATDPNRTSIDQFFIGMRAYCTYCLDIVLIHYPSLLNTLLFKCFHPYYYSFIHSFSSIHWMLHWTLNSRNYVQCGQLKYIK